MIFRSKRGFFWEIAPSALLFVLLLLLLNEWQVVFLMFFGVFAHEIGHLTVACLQKRRVYGIRISSSGAELSVKTIGFSYGKDALLHLGGIFANCVLSLLFLIAIRTYAHELCFFGFYFNLCLVLFHLLPVSDLDGGRALFSLLCLFFSYPRAGRIFSCISVSVSAVAFLVLLLLLQGTDFHLSLCLLVLFFWFGIWQKNKVPAI